MIFFLIFFCFLSDGSESFVNFLQMLGDRIELKGWQVNIKPKIKIIIIYFKNHHIFD